MKKNLILLSLVAMFLSSCEFIDGSLSTSTSGSDSETTNGNLSDITEDITQDITQDTTNVSSDTSSPSEDEEEFWYRPQSLSISLDDEISANYFNNTLRLQSLGEQKILVIPVNFTNYTCANTKNGCVKTRENIRKAMFGSSEETGWESVASFYHKSSYENLTLTGTVTDWYDADLSTTQFNNLKGYYDPTYYILRKAVQWYKTYSGSNLQEYDQNNDGYLDAVWLIYAAPNRYEYNTSGDTSFWAYTYWDYEQKPNLSSPVANTYAWASHDFMYEGNYSAGPDAHTYIHETGHIFGLDDYYTYDTNDWGAAGRVDMMDYNVGDHNAYSKMLLGWITPRVITSSGELNLHAFQNDGDCVLIRDDSWNGSAFDEYLLIEYYTPTGLNVKDMTGYANGVSTFSTAGIKVYHIDSRLMTFETSREYYTDTLAYYHNGRGVEYYTEIAASNTKTRSYNSNYKLIHLLESSGSNSFRLGNGATNTTLFQANKNFGVNVFSGFSFNGGASLPFTFKINSLNSEFANISFTTK